ncbi:MAG: NAD-dependent epimerase/dehydratase family protein, partial [Acidocella sp.]|nr:NAD-dependent epimerase/dehydratase family protein [Acidocella sp.]
MAAELRRGDFPIVVTGGTGWLGRATLNLLDRMLGPLFHDRVRVFGSSARTLVLPSGRDIGCLALTSLSEVPLRPSLWLHYACLTKDRVESEGHQAFMSQNDTIREHVASLIERHGAFGMFLPSSGAVYGPGRTTNPDPVINPYGAGKRRDERRFLALAAGNGMRLVTTRIFNIAGPFINKTETYAIASFITALLARQPVVIRARGFVYRSYVPVEDLILIALGILMNMVEAQSLCFDTQGEVTIEVEALAWRAVRLLGFADARVERNRAEHVPDNTYVGEGAMMRALAAQL